MTFQEKITQLDAIAENVPAVIIVHELTDWDKLKYMSPNGLRLLGITAQELYSLKEEDYHNRYFEMEMVEDYGFKIKKMIDDADPNEVITYFEKVRIVGKTDFQLYLSAAKIFHIENGKPSHIITFAMPIDSEAHIATNINRIIDENKFLKQHYEVFASLSKREKQILKFMALSKNSDEIADLLHISKTTVDTHRRNVRTKLQIESNYEIIQFAQPFGLL